MNSINVLWYDFWFTTAENLLSTVGDLQKAIQNDWNLLETIKFGSKASVDAWTAGKQDKVTKNTKNTLRSCTQHCQRISSTQTPLSAPINNSDDDNYYCGVKSSLVKSNKNNNTAVTKEPRESMFLFLPATLYSPPEGERGCLPANVQHRVNAVRSHYLLIISSSLRLCAIVGQKIIIYTVSGKNGPLNKTL